MPEFTDAQILEIFDWLWKQPEFAGLMRYDAGIVGLGTTWRVYLEFEHIGRVFTPYDGLTKQDAILKAAKVLKCPIF